MRTARIDKSMLRLQHAAVTVSDEKKWPRVLGTPDF
jgi:hypothetical protein